VTRFAWLPPFALLAACGASSEILRQEDTRVERLVVHRSGDSCRVRYEASTREEPDGGLACDLDWQRRGETGWTPLISETRTDARLLQGGLNLPAHVRPGDLVRFRARFLGRDGGEVSGFGVVAEVP